MSKLMPLSDVAEQLGGRAIQFILAEMARSRLAIDYVDGYMADLDDVDGLLRHEVRRQYNAVRRMIDLYRGDMDSMFNYKPMPVDLFLNATCELQKGFGKGLLYYEQAIKRLLDVNRHEHSKIVCHMVVGENILHAASLIMGIEHTVEPKIRHLGSLGSLPTAFSMMKMDGERDVRPNTLGYIGVQVERLNHMVSEKLCKEARDIEHSHNAEITRAMEISSDMLIASMTDYEKITYLFKDEGHTWKEAEEMSAKK